MVRVVGAVAGLVAVAAGLSAQPEGGPVAATAASPAATFSVRAAGADQFKVVPADAPLRAGDLLVCLPGAVARGANGAVTVTSLADYDNRSPLPSLETAFTLNEAKDADLDVTLDRGRLDLTNTKPAGPATAVVRFWEQAWTVTLDAPGTRVAFELCARWPAGARFKADPAAKATPVASLVCLVLKGDPTVKAGAVTVGLAAPPGPALIEWDSVVGADPRPRRLEKLPDWADPTAGLSDDGKKLAAAVEKFRAGRANDAAATSAAFLASAEPVEQRVGLVTAGALDDLDVLGRGLAVAKTQEEWDFGITVVRHWLGRCPGQDQKLYAQLTGPARGYTPAQARVVMQLLFGFSPEDLRQPETFEVLIDYLTDDVPAIRHLAAWHLVRAVPGGRAIGFKPGGSKAECEAAAAEWRRRVPPGQLPAPEKK